MNALLADARADCTWPDCADGDLDTPLCESCEWSRNPTNLHERTAMARQMPPDEIRTLPPGVRERVRIRVEASGRPVLDLETTAILLVVPDDGGIVHTNVVGTPEETVALLTLLCSQLVQHGNLTPWDLERVADAAMRVARADEQHATRH